jgi:hypothetical protein
MDNPDISLTDVLDNFLSFAETVANFENIIDDFETEISEFQDKLQILFEQYIDLPPESLTHLSINDMKYAALVKYLNDANLFTKNMNAYYLKRVEFNNLSSEFFEILDSINNKYDLDNTDNLSDKQTTSLISEFISAQQLYIPKITDYLIFFEKNISSLRREYNSLKSDYSKFVQ